MGYRIVYLPVKKLRRQHQNRSRRAALTGIAFVLFLWIISTFWEEGRRVLWEILPSEAAGVFTDLSQRIINGIS